MRPAGQRPLPLPASLPINPEKSQAHVMCPSTRVTTPLLDPAHNVLYYDGCYSSLAPSSQTPPKEDDPHLLHTPWKVLGRGAVLWGISSPLKSLVWGVNLHSTYKQIHSIGNKSSRVLKRCVPMTFIDLPMVGECLSHLCPCIPPSIDLVFKKSPGN